MRKYCVLRVAYSWLVTYHAHVSRQFKEVIRERHAIRNTQYRM
jgi:hypothetical protein